MSKDYQAPKVSEVGSLHEITLQTANKVVGSPADFKYPKGFPDFKFSF